MKKIDVQQNTEEWLKAREGRVTGSRLGKFISKRAYLVSDIKEKLDELKIDYGKGKKDELEALLPFAAKIQLMASGNKTTEFYQYIAEKLSVETGNEIGGEDPRDRGHRLETEATELFCQKNDIEVKVIDDAFFVSEKDDRIGYSPDGVFENDPTQGLEVKCPEARNHLKHYFEDYKQGVVPSDYIDQLKLAFLVNDELEKMHLVFYCPQLPDIPYYSFEITRKELAVDIVETGALLTELLDLADEMITNLKEDNDNF